MTWEQASFGELAGVRIEAVEGARPGALFASRYRIEGTLGSGAMGTVLRATDITLGRPVAIKVLRQALDEGARKRFLREGELTAGLAHPGIIRVYGGGLTEDGAPFLVLELIEGARELEEAITAAPERGLDMLLAIARAVGYAHRQGVVHRDLKPANVLVGADGLPRVCDFGLGWGAGVERLTQTGCIVGTPLFMSPEQLASTSAPPAPATDVWSLGVLLYWVLSGGVYPFEAQTLPALAACIACKSPTPPSELVAGVSPKIEAVCLRALAKQADDRLPDGDAFAVALEAARRGERLRAARFRVGPLIAVCVGVATALGAGGAAWWVRGDRARATLRSAQDFDRAVVVPAGFLEPAPLARVEAVAHDLDADLAWLDAPGRRDAIALLDRFAALRRLATHRAGGQVRIAELDARRSAPQLVVDALLLLERGQRDAAEERASAALNRDGRPDERSAAARILQRSLEERLVAATREGRTRPAPETAALLRSLGERCAALGGGPELSIAARRSALEEDGPEWRALLRRARERDDERALLSGLAQLGAITRAAPVFSPGPGVQRVLDDLLERLLADMKAQATNARRHDELWDRFVRCDATVFYGIDPSRTWTSEHFAGMVGMVVVAGQRSSLELLLAALRHSPHRFERATILKVASPQELEQRRVAQPESRALRLLAATLHRPPPHMGRRAQIERKIDLYQAVVRGAVVDLHPANQALAWRRLAQARFQLAKGDPVQAAAARAAIARARAIWEDAAHLADCYLLEAGAWDSRAEWPRAREVFTTAVLHLERVAAERPDELSRLGPTAQLARVLAQYAGFALPNEPELARQLARRALATFDDSDHLVAFSARSTLARYFVDRDLHAEAEQALAPVLPTGLTAPSIAEVAVDAAVLGGDVVLARARADEAIRRAPGNKRLQQLRAGLGD